MKQATDIFEKHWVKSTGQPCHEMTKYHMKYCIEAIDEALNIGNDNLRDKLVDFGNYLREANGDMPNEDWIKNNVDDYLKTNI